jgi:hypothetical protein
VVRRIPDGELPDAGPFHGRRDLPGLGARTVESVDPACGNDLPENGRIREAEKLQSIRRLRERDRVNGRDNILNVEKKL